MEAMLPAVASLSKAVSFASASTVEYHEVVVRYMTPYWYDQPRTPNYKHDFRISSARALRHAIRDARSLAREVADQLGDAGTPVRRQINSTEPPTNYGNRETPVASSP